MEELYSMLEIKNIIENKQETIKYYILKGNQVGIKITRETEDGKVKELVKREISSDENEIKDLIKSLVKCENDFSQLEYVIEDFKKRNIK